MKLIPWIEVNHEEDIANAVEGLTPWADVTRRAIVTTTIDALDGGVFQHLLDSAPPSMKITPGLKTNDEVGGDGIYSSDGWAEIFEGCASLQSLVKSRHIVLENETATKKFVEPGGEPVDLGAFRGALEEGLAALRDIGWVVNIWPSVVGEGEAFYHSHETSASIASVFARPSLFGYMHLITPYMGNPDSPGWYADNYRRTKEIAGGRDVTRMWHTKDDDDIAATLKRLKGYGERRLILYPGGANWVAHARRFANLADVIKGD